MDYLLISILNGLSYSLLLFMLSSGLTLIFSMMGVLNFAHASFYMLGAYFGAFLAQQIGFIGALIFSPLIVGLIGAAFEYYCLRKVRAFGHIAELLVTFGLSYVILEFVQLLWGRSAIIFNPPEILQNAAFTLVHGDHFLDIWLSSAPIDICAKAICTPFAAMRALMMLVALLMFSFLWFLLKKTRLGLIIQAAISHSEMVQCLGHNVPQIAMFLFGVGTALAALAGVLGGSTFITEPSMAAALGSLVFVVIVMGGMGSLWGAFWASLLIGLIQTFAISLDYSLLSFFQKMGFDLIIKSSIEENSFWRFLIDKIVYKIIQINISQIAPILPYLLLILTLVFKPNGLFIKNRDQ